MCFFELGLFGEVGRNSYLIRDFIFCNADSKEDKSAEKLIEMGGTQPWAIGMTPEFGSGIPISLCRRWDIVYHFDSLICHFTILGRDQRHKLVRSPMHVQIN